MELVWSGYGGELLSVSGIFHKMVSGCCVTGFVMLYKYNTI